jgi:hypothetical protein
MRITEKEWVLLSAFLDGELQGKEKLQLKRRLEQNSDLKQALKALSQTKSVLSQTPRLKLPRNFTLSEQPLPARKSKQPFFSYRLAAAVFSILLVGVLIFDSTSLLGSKNVELVSAPAYQEEVLEEAPKIALDNAAGSEQEETEKALPQEAPAAEMEEAPEAEMGEAPEAEMLAEGIPETEMPVDSEEEAAALDVEEGAVEDRSVFSEALPTPTEAPFDPLPTESSVPEQTTLSDQPGFYLPPIRILEILLGLGVIGFSLAAWRQRES